MLSTYVCSAYERVGPVGVKMFMKMIGAVSYSPASGTEVLNGSSRGLQHGGVL